jgi:hypothetical protein
MGLRGAARFITQEFAQMEGLRAWIIVAWIGLPTVMYGGFALLRLLNRDSALSPFQSTWFRAGHAHAGVLILMSLLYYSFLGTTPLPWWLKQAACATLFVGILAQSGGFFIHMIVGQPNRPSIGNTVTALGALLLTGAIGVLVYGLIAAK